MTDRYTLLARVATVAYERALECSFDFAKYREKLKEMAEELAFLKEKASDLLVDFYFYSGREARRNYKWVRDRVVELAEELLALVGVALPAWERDYLEHWLKRIREVGEGDD